MKCIVTHFNPDLDAIASTWLVRKYLPGFSEAEITFVPAGETLEGKKVDTDANIVHVDTGMGRFDHHQTSKRTCATKLVYEYLVTSGLVKKDARVAAIGRFVEQVNDIDHFGQIFWPEPDADRYGLSVEAIIDGWRLIYPRESLKIVDLGFIVIEAIVKQLENKIWAEGILASEGRKFSSKWGKAIAFETTNDEVVHLAQKKGYMLVVRKDPRKGYVRIKVSPVVKLDVKKLYLKLCKADPAATWYLHASGKMILNGSTKNPKMKPSKLSLDELVRIIESDL